MKHGEAMKVILSRKGFDSSYGGMPSPILPDGTLLSLPIPSKKDEDSNSPVKYTDLYYGDKSYYNLIKELKPRSKIKENYYCHLDPDLKNNNLTTTWEPLFGQENQSLSHLNNNGIGHDDLFLFFGWFKQCEMRKGSYKFVRGAPDLHIIWGYLQVDKKYSNLEEIPKKLLYHPHATQERFINNNSIYTATKKFSKNNELNGFGCFSYNPSLVLTKKGYSRTKWNLPQFFNDVDITYHSKKSFTEEYFVSASKGQEFVISEDERIEEWAINLIQKSDIIN